MAFKSQSLQPTDRFGMVTDLFKKLETITAAEYLDLAGFVHNYHSLNIIQLYGRRIVVVDDFALHLIWKEKPAVHLIKALPDGLFDAEGNLQAQWHELHILERSILYSYLHLIQGRRDLVIASDKELSLVPEPFHGSEGWARWTRLCDNIRIHIERYDHKGLQRLVREDPAANPFNGKVSSSSPTSIHIRFWYGDLRLTRLNLITFWWHLIAWLPWQRKKRADNTARRGHFFHTRNPVSTFWTGFGLYIVLIFAYLTTTLTAMQVALAVPASMSGEPDESNPDWFSKTCQMFSYVVLLAVVIQVPLVMLYVVFAAIGTWVGWRQKKRRNPALQGRVPGQRNRANPRDAETGSNVDSDQAVLGAQQH
ncbi:unnamed protein product [Zymoseptoria tritici ST99CH_3D1]|nr:unnamed protein product [Zymoseptoria tritici ST99CH_3D1]